MYWLDKGYEPSALFTASMSGDGVGQLHFDDDRNCTENARSLNIDPVRGILFWTQPHLSVIRAISLRHDLRKVKSLNQLLLKFLLLKLEACL